MSGLKGWLALAAVLVLCVISYFQRDNAQFVAQHFHSNESSLQDLAFWIFGFLLTATAAYTYFRRRDQFDWRWGVWFGVGAMLLFAEVDDVIWLKEATCNMIVGTHHNVSTGPCYRP